MGIEVKLSERDKALLLDLLERRDATGSGGANDDSSHPFCSGDDKGSSSSKARKRDGEATSREQRVREARAEEKAEEQRAKARAALIHQQLNADSALAAQAARATAEAARAAKRGESATVRITIYSAEKPSERKPVVLDRTDDIGELLKAAKAKLRMKKAMSAKLHEGGANVCSTAELDDGAVVAVSSKPADDEPRPPANAAETAGTKGGAATAAGAEVDPEEEVTDALAALRQLHLKSGSSLINKLDAAASRRTQEQLAAAMPPTAMLSAREALPMATKRQEVVEAVEAHPVVVLQGETGCGKSTQLPQFLLEAMVKTGHGGDAAIVVTQPRRVSAVALAQRVAEERGEAVGEVVGYAVRGEARRSARTRILFCTAGVLLKQLAASTASSQPLGLTHIVIDEVHERSMITDFLLCWLRERASATPSTDSQPQCCSPLNPKIVLMSATLQASAFAEYMGSGTAVLCVPGRTFPVRQVPLEQVIEASGWIPPRGTRPGSGAKYAKPGMLPHASQQTLQTLSKWDGDGEIDYAMVQHVVKHIVTAGEPGGILVFLTGVREIDGFCASLGADEAVRSAALVLPLHGSLSAEQQRRVFQRPPAGLRKIIVATNVAESSITVPDIVHVVDAGKVKERRWDAAKRLAKLEEVWISDESAKQRSGRAGRTQPGVTWQLWPSVHALQRTSTPEMARAPLEELVLQACLLGFTKPATLLAKAPQPPSPASVRVALENLCELQALEPHPDGTWGLTPLGAHLASMPIDPRLGKMLILSTLLDCTDAALTIAAALSCQHPVFSTPKAKQQEATMVYRELFGGLKSDTLAACEAFTRWRAARARGARAEREYCDMNFVSARALREIGETREQLQRALHDAGFADGGKRSAKHGDNASASSGGAAASGLGLASQAAFLRALITCALYPNVARATRTRSKQNKAYEKLTVGDAKQVEGAQKQLVTTANQVWMHPSSVNANPESPMDGLYAFVEKSETSRVFLCQTTVVSPLALLVFGARPQDVNVGRVKEMGRIDLPIGIDVRVTVEVACVLKLLRGELDRLLLRKVVMPPQPLCDSAGGGVITALRTLLANGQ